MTDIVNTPRIGYERHGRLGGLAGTLIGIANVVIKPVAGTLSSLTWFCRGIYANVNNRALVDKGLEALPMHTLGLKSSFPTTNNREQFQHSKDINQAVKFASKATGFSSDVCRQIISDFDSMKSQISNNHSHQHLKSQ